MEEVVYAVRKESKVVRKKQVVLDLAGRAHGVVYKACEVLIRVPPTGRHPLRWKV